MPCFVQMKCQMYSPARLQGGLSVRKSHLEAAETGVLSLLLLLLMSWAEGPAARASNVVPSCSALASANALQRAQSF